MIGSLILSGVGMVASGIGSANQNAENKRNLALKQSKSDSFYNQQMYEDPLARSDNAAVLGMVDDRMKRYVRRTDNTSAITNGTKEAKIKSRDNVNRSYADIASNIAATSSTRKNALAKLQFDKSQATDLAQGKLDASMGANWTKLAGNAANLAGSAIDSWDGPEEGMESGSYSNNPNTEGTDIVSGGGLGDLVG